ncbi:MAG: hypothetical protein H8E57_05625, partial [Candidatus Cloacimonetes bacterium]|nr:hypothetical protein [Candidatus Cloacimonadota bacterium]
MKNIISFLIGLIIVNALSAQTAEVPAIGDGTSGNPYQIANLNNLYWLSQNSGEWNKYYIQTTSIDASDTENWNGGEGFDPIGNSTIHFTGEYNGNFNTIEGFYINRPDAEKQAMFGMINGAVIQNLQLENVSITARRHLGALVGFGGWSALVQNCSSSGSVNTTYDWAGGLIGYASNGFVVSRCSSSCNVSG